MMRAYSALTSATFKSQLRDPVGVFFVIIFSPVLLLLLGLLFGNEPAAELGGRGHVDNMAPGLVAMSLFIIGTAAIPQNQAILRTSGALTRLRMTPLRPFTFFASNMTVNFVLGMVGPALTILMAVVLFGVEAPRDIVAFAGALILGMLAMMAFGYALASLIRSVGAATGIGNILMIALMLTSGAFVPVELLDPGVQLAFRFSPSFHAARLVARAWMDEPWPWSSVAVLAGMIVAFGAAALVLARRK